MLASAPTDKLQDEEEEVDDVEVEAQGGKDVPAKGDEGPTVNNVSELWCVYGVCWQLVLVR